MKSVKKIRSDVLPNKQKSSLPKTSAELSKKKRRKILSCDEKQCKPSVMPLSEDLAISLTSIKKDGKIPTCFKVPTTHVEKDISVPVIHRKKSQKFIKKKIEVCSVGKESILQSKDTATLFKVPSVPKKRKIVHSVSKKSILHSNDIATLSQVSSASKKGKIVENKNPFRLLISAALPFITPGKGSMPKTSVKKLIIGTTATKLRPKLNYQSCEAVHLPAKVCSHCKKDCLNAALIQCDLCPVLCHANCLDPPLANLPDIWVCSAHPSKIENLKLLSSVAKSKRVKLYNQFSDAISQDLFRIDYLKKMKQRLERNKKSTLFPSTAVYVPSDVRKHYESPSLALPNKYFPVKMPVSNQRNNRTKEQLEFLTNVVCFQANLAEHLFSNESSVVQEREENEPISTPEITSDKKLNSEDITILADRLEKAGDRFAVLLAGKCISEEKESTRNSEKEEALKKYQIAALSPIDRQGVPVPIYFHSFTLGLGSDKDLCFSKFGTCDFVSSKHAIIFYDEITKHYELINYSSWGTIVDNVFYGTDDPDWVGRSEPSVSLSERSHRYLFPPSVTASARRRPILSCPKDQDINSCWCVGRKTIGVIKYGGTATLYHGSYIQCGCFQFVFSITKQGVRIV